MSCPKCNYDDLYTEVTTPGPSFAGLGPRAWYRGGVLYVCKRCGHAWKTDWPKRDEDEQAQSVVRESEGARSASR